MVKVHFYENEIADDLIQVVVIASQMQGKWILCKHKERITYEIPGGHREKGESLLEAAKRELYEETGAISFDIKPMVVFGIQGKTKMNKHEDDESYGMLFYADIKTLGKLEYEINEIIQIDDLNINWTYPSMHPILLNEVIKRNGIDR